MATLVFDIETSALPLEQFDEAQQESKVDLPLVSHSGRA